MKPSSCKTCMHRTGMDSCGQPVEAGLSEKFEIHWHERDGIGCKHYSERTIKTGRRILKMGGEWFVVVNWIESLI